MDTRSDSGQLPPACSMDASSKPRRRRSSWNKQARPFTREQLDQRTVAFRMFENLVASVIRDVGGESEISAVQRELVDLADLSLAASTLTRLASRIGVHRISRDVTPDPIAYARSFDEAAE
jgi:hypothetical protein